MSRFAAPRPAQPTDLDELLRLATGMFTDMNGEPPAAAWRRQARDALQRRVGHDLLVYAVDHPDRRNGDHPDLVAFASGAVAQRLPSTRNLDGRVGYIQWVATDPACRRQGLARAVTNALLDAFDRDGIAMNELHTSPDARELYKSMGFELAPHPSMRRYPGHT